jgi:1-acyl-sn-glycerol-3-phosphate acyltransferase
VVSGTEPIACAPLTPHPSPLTAPPAETWLRACWYDLLHVAAMTGFTLGFSYRFQGTRHMPKSGPVLVIANHQSFLDPFIVGLAVKRHLTYLARKTLFKNPLLARAMRGLNAVAIDQEGVGKEGLKTVVGQLQLGKAVLVFPEGSRTPDGAVHPLRPGVHLLIRRTRAPVVPVGIAGAYQAWPIWRNYPIPAPLFLPAGDSTIAVAVGCPFDSKKLAAMKREDAGAELFAALQKMQIAAEQLRRR